MVMRGQFIQKGGENMKNKKRSMKMFYKLMRIVEVPLMEDACATISSLIKIARTETVSSNDDAVLNDLILRRYKELILSLRLIGFFDDNSK